MKPIIFCTVFLWSALCANAQTVIGKVYREGTDSVIIGASVYYGGSTYGTITDDKGQFRLAARSEQVPLTISSIGYNSASVHYQPGKPLLVYLKPKTQVLHDIIIRADGMSRKDEIWLFTREFLGLSYYARNCSIDNIDDIDFFYNKKAQTLTATCDKPIIIDNKVWATPLATTWTSLLKLPNKLILPGIIFLRRMHLTATGIKLKFYVTGKMPMMVRECS